MKVAITAYVDNKDYFADECNLMTWTGKDLDSRFKFVLYAHPDIIDKIDVRPNVKVFSYSVPDDNYYNDYRFARSIVFPYDYPEPLEGYNYVLKTDTDVFIGPEIINFPFGKDKISIGVGHYSHGVNMERDMTQIAKDFGYPNYKRIQDMSSTIICEKNMLIELMRLCDNLGRSMYYNLDSDGEWTKSIYRGKIGEGSGICSMYSLEIILSSLFDSSDILITDKIDHPSNHDTLLSDVYHIHCYHTDSVYSKFQARDGKYQGLEELPKEKVNDYCLSEHIDRVKTGINNPEMFNKPIWSH